jgi:hypothetical protein
VKIILQGIVGSTAYGLDTPSSDIDRMGVFVAPTKEIVSFHPPKESIVTAKPDVTLHEVGKFLSLVLRCNPSVTELLWLDDYEEADLEWGLALTDLRRKVLSAHLVKNAYLGYATQQFKKLLARGDGTFGPDLAKRTQKHARHLRRLVDQGYELYTTGKLAVRVKDPEVIRYFGQRVEADPEVAIAYMARAEAQFATARTVLPAHPDEKSAEEFLLAIRKAHWEI